MKKFVQIFKIPLIIFGVFLVVGIACKIITDSRPEPKLRQRCVMRDGGFIQ